jgi:hypothetical protein
MISHQRGESFVPAKMLYAAIYEETQQLILVVEAADEDEAGHRIDAVLPFFGVKEVAGIGFVKVKSCPLGVASFLDAFFKGTGLGSVRYSVGPSTDSRH